MAREPVFECRRIGKTKPPVEPGVEEKGFSKRKSLLHDEKKIAKQAMQEVLDKTNCTNRGNAEKRTLKAAGDMPLQGLRCQKCD